MPNANKSSITFLCHLCTTYRYLPGDEDTHIPEEPQLCSLHYFPGGMEVGLEGGKPNANASRRLSCASFVAPN